MLKIQMKQGANARVKGVSLVEMAIAMMIIAVISVAVSNLVLTGVQSQMNQGNEEHMQIIAYNIVDDMRLDLRRAQNHTVLAANRLQVTLTDGSIVNYEFDATGTRFQRRSPTATKIYNTMNNRAGQLHTVALRFVDVPVTRPGPPVTVISTEVTIPDLTITRINRGTDSAIDAEFGPPQFSIRNITFDSMNTNTFQ